VCRTQVFATSSTSDYWVITDEDSKAHEDLGEYLRILQPVTSALLDYSCDTLSGISYWLTVN
jgi:hypothetical protein